MNLTQEDVQEIIRLLDNSSFNELKLETDRFRLTLRRAGTAGWTQETQTAQSDQRGAGAAQTSNASQPAEVALEPGVTAVRAPLVGTFYRAPKPGAASFVEAGAQVEEETVVAIIETMKLMNSVHAGVRGTITEICANNAEFVEHGRVLMKVRA
jgi:acetyl-CoA carboxylase biotin carboxyl carrier protein